MKLPEYNYQPKKNYIWELELKRSILMKGYAAYEGSKQCKLWLEDNNSYVFLNLKSLLNKCYILTLDQAVNQEMHLCK